VADAENCVRRYCGARDAFDLDGLVPPTPAGDGKGLRKDGLPRMEVREVVDGCSISPRSGRGAGAGTGSDVVRLRRIGQGDRERNVPCTPLFGGGVIGNYVIRDAFNADKGRTNRFVLEKQLAGDLLKTEIDGGARAIG